MIFSSQYSVARWLTRPSSDAAGDAAGQPPLAELPGDPEASRRSAPSATSMILRWSLRTRKNDGFGGRAGRRSWGCSSRSCSSVLTPGGRRGPGRRSRWHRRRCRAPTPMRTPTGAVPGRVVDDEAEDGAGDDAAGEEATETDEVAAAQPGVRRVGALIDHSPESLSLADTNTSGRAARDGDPPIRHPATARNYHSQTGRARGGRRRGPDGRGRHGRRPFCRGGRSVRGCL